MDRTGSDTTLLYQFNSLFARKMFNVETNHQHTGKTTLHFLFTPSPYTPWVSCPSVF